MTKIAAKGQVLDAKVNEKTGALFITNDARKLLHLSIVGLARGRAFDLQDQFCCMESFEELG